MEQVEEYQEQELPKLIITEEIRSYLYQMAKWANFLAVVGFVLAGIMIMAALTMGAAIESNKELSAMVGKMGSLGGAGLTAFTLVYAFAIFYPSLLLFKYSTKAKLGVLFGEQESLNEAFSKLKSLFKYWGIIVAIFIAMYVLMIFSNLLRLGA